MSSVKGTQGERIIAVFEAIKGLLVLLAGFGLLRVLHRPARQIAEELIQHLHLNAAKHYPHIFMDLARNITNTQLWLLAMLAFAYAAIRLMEAYGLWYGRRWAEWLAVASGSIYIPLEIYELVSGTSWIKLLTLVLNVSIVLYIGYRLRANQLQAH